MADKEPPPGQLAGLVDDGELEELRAVLESAQGQVISVRRGVADELLLRFGPSGTSPDARHWRVATQASDWVLATHDGVLTSARFGTESFATSADCLRGAAVTGVSVTDALALVILFTEGRWLEVQGQAAGPQDADDPPHWEVLTPDGEVVSAGPGLTWSRGSAHDATAPSQTAVPLREWSGSAVVQLWLALTSELRRRGMIQNPEVALHDIAVEHVRARFGGFRGTYRDAGWDLLTDDGRRVEVKAVMRAGGKRGSAIVVPTEGFDVLVAVMFDEELRLIDALQIPASAVADIAAKAPMNRDRHRRVRWHRLVNHPSAAPLELD